MKQVLQNLHNGETQVLEVPIPTPQAGEALVKTAVSLVSAGTERMVVEFAEKSLAGKVRARPDLARQVLDKARREGLLTTLEAAFNRLDQPMPLGYSSAGTIVALGAGVTGFKIGQRVACAGGGYAVHAEYVTVPKILLTPLPEQVEFDQAAFTTLGAIALHGFRLSKARLGERVAVIGLGLLGLLAAGIAQAAGCQVLGVELDAQRVELANKMGIRAVLRELAVEAAQSFTRGQGCDAILICADSASADPVTLAGTLARERASVVAIGAVGQELPRKLYYEKELTFLNSRSYGPGRYDPLYEEAGQDYPIGYVRWTEGRNMEAFVDLLAGDRVDVRPLITHRFPIEQAAEAYDLITGKSGQPFVGVLLEYPEETPGQPGGTPNRVVQSEHRTSSQKPPDAGLGTVKLGVLGAGNFATAVMLPAIKKLPGLERMGIASASGASAQDAATRFGFQFAASGEDSILENPEINTVAILTRHHLHARQVITALKNGKYVFCEKPLAICESDLVKIEQALAMSQAGVEDGSLHNPQPAPLLMVGFNRRFAPLAQRLSLFLHERQEPLAMHYRINAGYLPPAHWTHDPEQGGGRIIGEGCHFIDFLAFLAGAPPISVSAQGLPDLGRYREDNVLMSFGFPDGSLGTISYLANGDKSFPKERLEVFCGGRVAVLDDFRSLEITSNGRRQSFYSRLRQDKGHANEWLAFVNAIRSGGKPPIPYDHLAGVTRASFAAVEALHTGQAIPVKS